jgi:hypothetical protein
MLFLVTDPIGPQDQVELYQHIILEVLLLIDLTVLHSLDPIPTEEIPPPVLGLLLITRPIDRVFQEHLLTEDPLRQILVTETLVLPEVIVALAGHQEIIKVPEVLLDPQGPLEIIGVLEVLLPGPQAAFAAQEVLQGPQVAFVARAVLPDLQVADLVVDLVVEDNNSNKSVI